MLWNERSRRGKILVAVAGVIVGLVLIGALAGEDTTTASEETTTSAEAPEAQEAALTASTPKGRVEEAVGSEVEASGWAGTLEVQDVSFQGNEAQITLTTPEGGFSGASCGDLNDGAEAVFVKVYDDAGWTGGAVIVFKGGLVDTSTGQPVPDVNTGIFTMPAAKASQIDWGNEDVLLNIDWDNYRDFCHPALQ